MENNQIMLKEKMNFLGIIKESLKITTKNPRFIFLTFLTSLPLFFFLISQEILFQQTLIENVNYSHLTLPITYAFSCEPRPICLCLCPFWIWTTLGPYPIRDFIASLSWNFFLSGSIYFALGHLLDLLITIITVNSASLIYAAQDNDYRSVSIKEMFGRPFKQVGFRGPLITSIYALTLASLTSIGLVSMATQFLFIKTLAVIFILAFIGLFIKYMEWGAIWNMGLVISVLEGKHGDVGLGVSAYISRGNRRRGFWLVLLFFVWRIVLRLGCLYLAYDKGGAILVEVTIGHIWLVCIGNVMKWVVFTVHFYDCKKRFLEKKVDVEQGRAAQTKGVNKKQ